MGNKKTVWGKKQNFDRFRQKNFFFFCGNVFKRVFSFFQYNKTEVKAPCTPFFPFFFRDPGKGFFNKKKI